MATNALEVRKTTNELEVIYDWGSVSTIWEHWFKGKISMREREESLAFHRTKLDIDMAKRYNERHKL